MLMSMLSGCQEKSVDENPFFTAWETPFGVPPFDKIKEHHYKPAIEEGIVRHEAQIDSIVRSTEIPTFANVIEAMESDDVAGSPLADSDEESGVDDRLLEAIDMVITDGQASISMLQRRMKIGYARAGRLIDDMAARGIVSKSVGSKPREVLISREEFEKIKDTLV